MNKAERNAEIALLRQKGGTFKSVGKAFGISAEGARQAISKHNALFEDLQRGGLRGHGLDTRSMKVLRLLMDIKPRASPTLDQLREWLPANPNWRWQVLNARRGGRIILRRIEEFAVRHGLLQHKTDGIRNAGVQAWLCSSLELLTRIDNPTRDELRFWFLKNPGWESTDAIPPGEVMSIKEYVTREKLAEAP